jgi:hypothetical protein
VSTYCYVDTILHGATLEIKMGSPDAYESAPSPAAQASRRYILNYLVRNDTLRIPLLRVSDVRPAPRPAPPASAAAR